MRWSGVELLIASLVLRSLLVLLLWTLMSIVTYFSTAVACVGVIGCTTLHRSIVGHSLADCRSIAGDTDYQTVAGTEGVAGTGYTEDTDHGFPS